MFDINELRQGVKRRSIRFSIERLGHYEGGGTFATNLDFNRRLRLGKLGRHITETDTDAEGRTLGAAHDLAEALWVCAGTPNGIMGPRRRRFVSHFECDKFFADSFCFLFGEDRSPDELPFFERHEEAKAGFNWRGLLIEFVTVKWIANFG